MKILSRTTTIRPECAFLAIGIIWGSLYLVLTPPFQVPDEDRHFFRAYQVAEGGFIPTVHEGEVGGWLPESVFRCGASTSYMRWNGKKTISRDAILQLFEIPLNAKERVFERFRSSIYSPVAYLPSAMMIRIGIWFNWSPVVLMYLGRMVNLFCWLLLIYAAIRLIPFYKWVFVVLALTPMSLYQGASLSADSMTNALAFFTIAYFVYCAYSPDKQVGWRDLLLFFGLTVALSLSKLVFFLFGFLFLLIPLQKYSSRKMYFLSFTGLVVTNLLTCFAWCQIVSEMPIYWKPGVFPDQQVEHIVTHPFTYITTLLGNSRILVERGAKTFVGKFGWMDTPLPKWHFWSWALLLFLTALTDGCKSIRVRLLHKILWAAVFGAIFLLIVTLLYVYWNPVGAETMFPVQGRYYIPIAPLFFLCLYNRRLSFHVPAKSIGLTLSTALSLTHALFVIYARFYEC